MTTSNSDFHFYDKMRLLVPIQVVAIGLFFEAFILLAPSEKSELILIYSFIAAVFFIFVHSQLYTPDSCPKETAETVKKNIISASITIFFVIITIFTLTIPDHELLIVLKILYLFSIIFIPATTRFTEVLS